MYVSSCADSELHQLAEEMFTEHRRLLVGQARRYSYLPHEAEEALQQAFFYFLTSYDPESGAPPLYWMLKTIKHACWAVARKEIKHEKRRAFPEVGNDGEESEMKFEQAPSKAAGPEELVSVCDEINSRMVRLKPDERSAVVCHAIGYSYKEIADLKNWTYTKVNRCITEGRSAARAA